MVKPVGPVMISPVTTVTGMRADCTLCDWTDVQHSIGPIYRLDQAARAHAAEHCRETDLP